MVLNPGNMSMKNNSVSPLNNLKKSPNRSCSLILSNELNNLSKLTNSNSWVDTNGVVGDAI